MRLCASVTKDFVYDEREELVCKRFRSKTANEKMLPVRIRQLTDVLDPQPRCCTVHTLWLQCLRARLATCPSFWQKVLDRSTPTAGVQ